MNRRRVNAWALAVIGVVLAGFATAGIVNALTTHSAPDDPAAAIAHCRADKQAAITALSRQVDPGNTMPINEWNRRVAALPEPASCKALTDAERQAMESGTQ